MAAESTPKPRMARHTKIFIGLIVGAFAGVIKLLSTITLVLAPLFI